MKKAPPKGQGKDKPKKITPKVEKRSPLACKDTSVR
jgi:hypothetical protein